MNSPLQNKLANYEEEAPPKVWDSIAAALDEKKEEVTLPSKLKKFEEQPSQQVWKKITDRLNNEPAHPSIFTAPQPYMYAKAAAIIIAIASAATFFINKNISHKAAIHTVYTHAMHKHAAIAPKTTIKDTDAYPSSEKKGTPSATNK